MLIRRCVEEGDGGWAAEEGCPLGCGEVEEEEDVGVGVGPGGFEWEFGGGEDVPCECVGVGHGLELHEDSVVIFEAGIIATCDHQS